MNSRQGKHFNVRWLRSALLVWLTATGACSAWATGVTVITHGWALVPGTYPSWVDQMAQAVTNVAYRKGLASSMYHITYSGDIVSGYTRSIANVSTLTAANSDEVVVTVDWSVLANNLDAFNNAGITTEDIARWLAQDLLTLYPQQGLTTPLASRPIHLIGHSRGGSVMLETAKFLGSSGIWVDQVTTLDPHPLAFPDFGVMPGSGDPAVHLYENVVFADNYWRANFAPFDFDGQSIPGSEDVNLNDDILVADGYTVAHQNVHAWYHGTIGFGSTFPTSDGTVSIPDDWYVLPNPARNLSGFLYSRLASGTLRDRPAFSYATGSRFGGHHVREINSRDGGAQWANIGFIHTPAYPANRLPQGSDLAVTYK